VLNIRPRRNRVNEAIRSLVRETVLSKADFIYPLFLLEGENLEVEVNSMPGQYRRSLDRTLSFLEKVVEAGIVAIALFPVVPESKKNQTGDESWNPQALIPTSISKIKEKFPTLIIVADVALDPYNSDGHDGIVENGIILNDPTVRILTKQAVVLAQAGADIIAPSDMMDGRVLEIRGALDRNGFQNIGIMSYSAKYASAYYGPFREALDSAPKSGDKKTYQMDPANSQEALQEVALDLKEGADIVMIKPAGAYLDIIAKVKSNYQCPLAAYQVSGEYAMIMAAIEKGWLDRDTTILESLLSIKRAGADMILTYFALDACNILEELNE
jgi:porphobilinogen synthase